MTTDRYLSDNIQIVNSCPADLDLIFSLFEKAIKYQEKNGYNLWPQFSRTLIETEMHEKRHWKVMRGTNTLGIFSVLYNDPVIWGETDHEPSIYLHRITVNPLFKGTGLMAIIRTWALEHAKENNKRFVRMDTWGGNENLRRYYVHCGFCYIGQRYLENVNGQTPHYGGSVLSLFQIGI